MQERQAVSFRRLSWLAALLAALAALGAYVAYAELLHYRRRAAEHLPADTLFAARVDVEQVLLFEPVRRHLLPLVEELPPPAQPALPEAPGRLARLRAAGLNLGLDLREIVVATTAGGGWLVALGGMFPEQGLLAVVEQVLHDENVGGWRRVDAGLERSPAGALRAQAEDGTLILASERATLAAALPASSRHRELGLEREGAGGAALAPQAASAWAYPGPPEWLSDARVLASLRLARDAELELRVDMGDAARARALAEQTRRWISLPSAGESHDLPAGREDPEGLWARTRTLEVEGTTVKLLSSWRPAELDRRARELAAWARRQLAAAGRAGS